MIYSLKKTIKKLFKVNDSIEQSVVLNILNFYRLRWLTPSTFNQIEKRKELNIFDYQELSKRLAFYPYHPIPENNLYGTVLVLSRFNKISYFTRIEHGLYFGSMVPDRNMFNTTKQIITYSTYRKNHINNRTNIPVACVGPYIKYAKILMLDIDFYKLKQELGKVLLVFPAHSIETVTASYDESEFISFIEGKKNEFDSILICLYWKDIELGRFKEYEKLGYKIVTAGHSYDYYFLDRLKTIISLADMTISNKIGTHIGYCTALHKPHYVFKSNVEYSAAGENKEESEKELFLRKDNDLLTCLDDMEIVYKAFNSFSYQITEEQKECISYYWGDEDILSG